MAGYLWTKCQFGSHLLLHHNAHRQADEAALVHGCRANSIDCAKMSEIAENYLIRNAV